MRLGVLGGTFDPVHIGHLVLAEVALEQLLLDRVLFVPAGQPWCKAERRVSPAVDRLTMLRLSTASNSAFTISAVETERPGPSYTVDTIEWLHAEQPGMELFFIMGEDALADLPSWRQPERIVELARLAVARRPGQGSGLRERQRVLPLLAERLVWVEMPLIEISASWLRDRVRGGLTIRYLVPDAVEAYIREHGLYRD